MLPGDMDERRAVIKKLFMLAASKRAYGRKHDLVVELSGNRMLNVINMGSKMCGTIDGEFVEDVRFEEAVSATLVDTAKR
jgi:predicted SPOUT superfamily RNA methylase MTH1